MKAALIMIFLSAACSAEVTFKKTKIILSGYKFEVEVADTDDRRQQGLMGRKKA